MSNSGHSFSPQTNQKGSSDVLTRDDVSELLAVIIQNSKFLLQHRTFPPQTLDVQAVAEQRLNLAMASVISPEARKKTGTEGVPAPQVHNTGRSMGPLSKDTTKERPDGGRNIPGPWQPPYPWEYDKFVRNFERLLKLEKEFRLLEKKTDKYIDGYQCWKYDLFEKNGGQQFDKTRNYSSEEGQRYLFPKFYPSKLGSFQSLDDRSKMSTLIKRLFLLDLLHKELDRDLERLWRCEHDGKSSRYYRETFGRPKAEAESGDTNSECPWYLQNGRISFLWQEKRQHESECEFCVVLRMFFEMEMKLTRLQKTLRRLPNTYHMPRGYHKARQASTYYSNDSDSDSSSCDCNSDNS